MTTVSEKGIIPTSFSAFSRIHVADLGPNPQDLSSYFLEAAVALIWPYSSSSHQLSLLLAEKDVRLRKSKGQLKVTFHNGCAKAVARSRLGIGDIVRLNLQGISWERRSDQLSTPGKKTDWDLHVAKHVQLEIIQDSAPPIVVDYRSRSPSPEVRNGTAAALGTPQKPAHLQTNGEIQALSSPLVKTPARFPHGSYKDTLLDPFSSQGDVVDNRARKKTKFGRHSGAWRLEDETVHDLFSSSPPPQQVVEQTTNGVGQAEEPSRADKAQASLDPRDVPQPAPREIDIEVTEVTTVKEAEPESVTITNISTKLENPLDVNVPSASIAISDDSVEDEAPQIPTPRLIPLASPGLDLVSPLVTRSGYFPNVHGQLSELEQAGEPTAYTKPQRDAQVTNDEVLLDFRSINATREDVVEVTSTSPDQTRPEAFVDLDFLQEQIDKSVSTNLDKIENVEVVEDEDMYGPSIHHTSLPDNMTSPQQVESLFSLPTTHKPPSEMIEGIVELSPSNQHVLTHRRHEDSDVVEEPSDDLLEEYYQQHLSRQVSEAPSHQSASLDGAVDERQELRFTREASTQAQEAFPDVPLRKKSASPVEQPIQQDRIFHDLITPEATQAPVSESQLSKVQEKPVMDQLPPTPVESQHQPEPISSSYNEIPTSLIDEMPLPVLPGDSSTTNPAQDASSRRKSRRLLRRPVMSDEITSEYFTPRKLAHEPKAAAPTSSEETSRLLRVKTPLLTSNEEDPIDEVEPHASEEVENVSRSPYPLRSSQATPHISKQGVTTSLSYYPFFTSLSDYFNHNVDILAVCTSDSSKIERAKKGPKDHFTTLHLTDSSFPEDDNSTTTAQLLRPKKDALPSCKRGDLVLMRDLKVQTQNRKPMLLSTSTSAWTIFRFKDSSDVSFEVHTAGPPIEYGPMEETRACALRQWWISEEQEKYRQEDGNQELLLSSPSLPPPTSPSTQRRMKPPPLELGPRTGLRRRGNRTDNTGNALDQDQDEESLTSPLADSQHKSSTHQDGIQQSVEEYSPISPTSVRHFSRPVTRSMRAESSDLHSPSLTRRSVESTTASVTHPSAAPTTAKHKRGGGGSVGGVSTRSSRRSESVIHELRDGTTYVDHDGAGSGQNTISTQDPGRGHRRTRSRRDSNVVHELRDGAKYVD